MKVVLGQDLGEEFLDDLRATFPQIDIQPAYTSDDQLREIPDAEVLIGTMSQDVFLAAGQLQWFQFIGIGFDPFVRGIPGFVESGLVLTNCRETHVVSMADHVLAMILAFAHYLPELLEDQRAHTWDAPRYKGRMVELAGTTMGILALGDIGRAVAQRARGFDMEIYAADIADIEPPPGVRAVWGLDRLDEMLALSDWLVITAPLTGLSHNLIDHKRLEHLKPGAHIIVVSRGHIVDQEALIQGLGSGRIGGAALDALDQEPLPPDNPLWDLPNVIISPHTSADSTPMWERRKQIAKENLRRYLVGESLMYVCDKKAGY